MQNGQYLTCMCNLLIVFANLSRNLTISCSYRANRDINASRNIMNVEKEKISLVYTFSSVASIRHLTTTMVVRCNSYGLKNHRFYID